MSPGFAQISIRPRLLAAAARHGEIDQGERDGKHVEGKICNDKDMRQCLFPWNFNRFFSLVLFTYLIFYFGLLSMDELLRGTCSPVLFGPALNPCYALPIVTSYIGNHPESDDLNMYYITAHMD